MYSKTKVVQSFRHPTPSHRCRSAAEVAIPGADAQIPPLRGPSRAGQRNGGREKGEWRRVGEGGKDGEGVRDGGGVGNERGRGIGKRGPIHNAEPWIKKLRWSVGGRERLGTRVGVGVVVGKVGATEEENVQIHHRDHKFESYHERLTHVRRLCET